jgi:ADP-heptose:LPS heptosyltransferase
MVVSPVENFLARTRAAKKVMVLDLGFLGDTVHLLPALWMVRQAYPEAELHVTVSSQVTSFMECAPWVNRVWGYMRYPRHATLRENFEFVTAMRREKFDVLINLNGSDRSSWLTFFSGARERLGRLPRNGGPPFWKQRFTAHVSHPFDGEPVYLQRCRCLGKAGFPFTQPEFHVELKAVHLQASGISSEAGGTYFHLSPFTTDDRKELRPEQLIELIQVLEVRWPEKKLVLSCAPNERERKKMDSLLQGLPRQPWRVFAGELNLMQLAAVIQHSAAHLCGDTGTLHMALMTATPTVSWFRPNPGSEVWIPAGERHRALLGTKTSPDAALQGIVTAELVAALQTVLQVAGKSGASRMRLE